MEQRREREIEVLAPAGSFETFQAVIRAGADAVYLGGNRFGARAYANNFGETELLRAIDYAHIHGRKVYLTVNTLLKEEEMGQLFSYLRPYYEQGLDAVIVQDMGALAFVRENFPGMDIHTSTQMTVTGACGASYMKELGASRVVTAREMSLEEIARIRREVDIEIETFVHGALCYCYSGQCLLSSMIGGRSGNRGRCAQPCRLPYEVYTADRKKQPSAGNFVLSPKDLCGVADIPALAKSGVYSLKIEGRMKQAEYAAGVVSVYRKYADRYLDALHRALADGKTEQEAHAFAAGAYRVEKADMQQLFDLGNRSGFTDGYYHKKNGKDMITFGKPNHAKANEALQAQIRGRYVHATEEDAEIKEKINGILRLKKDSPATIEVSMGEVCVCACGSEVQVARSQPLSEEKIRACIQKTGNTPFVFEELSVETDDGIFLPVQALNQLRREALEKLELELLLGRRRTCKEERAQKDACAGSPGAEQAADRRDFFAVSVEERGQAKAALEYDFVDAIYYDSGCYRRASLAADLGNDVAAAHRAGREAYLILPAVFRPHTADFYRAKREEILASGLDGVVVKSYDAAAFVREHFADRLAVVLDHSLYIWNHRAKDALWQLAPLRDTVPLELNRGEIRERENAGSEMLIYGYLPLMTSAQCVHANTASCDAKETVPLELNRGEIRERENAGSEMLIYGYLPLMTSAQCVHANTASCDAKETVLYLKDRYGKYFPVKNHCSECYNVIYNTTPLVLFGARRDCKEAGIRAYRLAFTVEDAARVREILQICAETFLLEKEDFKNLYDGDYTNGHYKRGVE